MPLLALRPDAKPPFDGLPLSSLTTLIPDEWRRMMDVTNYSSLFPWRAAELIGGITHGMDIGFRGRRDITRTCRNLISATKDKRVEQKVSDLIAADAIAGKKSGPHDFQPYDNFWMSPIGAVPKKVGVGETQQVTDIRVIHHLSYPFDGESINNNSDDIFVKLGSFDDAINAVVRVGRNCHLTKIDVKAAYKLVPVRAEDWPLLGFKWRDKYYYERTLPFGLKSSCRQWEVYATALHHFINNDIGIRDVIHYVDDFLFVEESLVDAELHLADTLALCDRLGVPIAHDKTEGPVTKLTFLGIQLDTVSMTAQLSPDKLQQLTLLLTSWANRTSASMTELQSLCGVLNWVCKVVRPGRSFLRRIIDHSSTLYACGHDKQFQIPVEVQLDIAWWREFVSQYNGISLLYEFEWTQAPLIELFTDACEFGYGAKFGNRYIHGRWSPLQLKCARNRTAKNKKKVSMPYLELLSLVLAAATWGKLWSGKKITFRCDCVPVVQAIEKRSSVVERSMDLIRSLHFIAARDGFDFACRHIPGVKNISADALSRDMMSVFRLDTPQHLPSPDITGEVKLHW
jgi:Reverse transcriptase (RNA-dependent DNA polymerase)